MKDVQKRINLVRALNGYKLLYMPSHPRAMTTKTWVGYVYEHIVVAEEAMGMPLRDDEVVHHLDNVRDNNRKENLLVLTSGMHAKLHNWIDSGKIFNGNKKRVFLSSTFGRSPSTCEACKRTLQGAQERFCSPQCFSVSSRKIKNRPSKDVLLKELESLSFDSVGKKYNVSGNTIRKWLK